MTFAGKIRNEGDSFFAFPLRVFHLSRQDDEENKLIISVPKRIFKRAVKRNLIRRRIREAWRLNKSSFPASDSRHFLIVYTTSEILEYDRIDESVKKVLGKFS